MDNPNNLINQENKVSGEANEINQWQRLSPIAIVYFGASFIQALVGQFVYIASAVLVTYNSIKDNPWIGVPLAIGAVVLIVVSAILNFYFFQYRLTKSSIEIRSGVLNKKHINLPFSRIQNVKIEQPIYYRVTDFACLTLDTAGSSKQEAKVVALPLAFAEKLKLEIMAQHNQAKAHAAEGNESKEKGEESVATSSNEQIINTRSIKDLIIHGITSNRIWIFLGVLAPFYEKIVDGITNFLRNFGIDLAQIFDPTTHSMWQLGLYTLSLTMIIMLVLALFSIGGAIITFYGFTLSKIEDRYIRRSGLFTRHEVSMRLSRLQKIAHKRDWLDMLLKRVNVSFEQSSSQMSAAENGAIPNINDKIMVPSVTTDEALALIKDVYPDNRLGRLEFIGISKRFILRYIGYFTLPIYLIIASFLIIQQQFAALVPLSGVFAFICLLIFMRWKRWGYAIDQQFVYIRKGIFGVDYFVFPIYKIQQTTFKQSKFMKPKELCSVKLLVASGAMDIPFIKESQGLDIINRSLHQVETSGKSWM